MITTVAGTGDLGFSGDGRPAAAAAFFPKGVTVDATGTLYIADGTNCRVRRVDARTQTVTTVAGTGECGGRFIDQTGVMATSAGLSTENVAIDATGTLYVVGTAQVLSIDPETGVMTRVAGRGPLGFAGDGGPATEAQLLFPKGVAVDGAGNLYVADTRNHRVRRVDAGTGVITTVVGTGDYGSGGDGGLANAAELGSPEGLAIDGEGNLYIADSGNANVRKVWGIAAPAAQPGIGPVVSSGRVPADAPGEAADRSAATSSPAPSLTPATTLTSTPTPTEEPRPPTIISLGCTPTAALTGQMVTCSPAFSGTVSSYSWFTSGGSPANGSGATFSTSFGTGDVHTVSIEACNAAGCATWSQPITVTAPPIQQAGTLVLGFANQPPFDDVRIQRALFLLIDKQELMQEAGQWPYVRLILVDDRYGTLYRGDWGLASDLLRAAGHSPPQPFVQVGQCFIWIAADRGGGPPDAARLNVATAFARALRQALEVLGTDTQECLVTSDSTAAHLLIWAQAEASPSIPSRSTASFLSP